MRSTLHAKRTPLASALAMALLSLGQAGPARAQTDAPKDRSATLETVVVTAQGRRENPLKVPYNISAIGGDDLQERRITDQVDLLREVAGASVVDRGYRNSGVVSGVTIRGLNLNGAALGDYQTSAVPAVSTYVNQTPIYANFLIKDLERVEVLRGPQGTLYGSGSLGGTLRYITHAPELKRLGGRVEGTFSKTDGSGGHNTTGDLMLNVPLGSTLAARVTAGKVRNAGVIDYVNIYQLDTKGVPLAPKGLRDPTAAYDVKKDADTVDISYGRIALLFKPNQTFSATLTYQTQSDDIGGRRQPTQGNNGSGLPYGKYENGSVQLEPSTRDVSLTSLEMELDLGFATLTSATSHYEQSGSSASENTGFYAKNNWLRDFYYNYPRPMASAVRGYGDKALVQELRLISKKGGAVDYIVGAFFQDQDLQASQMSYLRGLKAWADLVVPGNVLANENDFLYTRTQNFKDSALYGELTYHVTPRLRATGGVRFFDNKFSNDTTMGVPAWGMAPEQSVFSQRDKGHLFKANVSYDLAERQMLYATVSEGFRRGGANAVPLTGNFKESATYQSYAPDTNTNYELGIKGASDSFKYNISAFYIDWKNVQVETSTPNWGFFAAQNGGRARSQGIEVELSGSLGADWRYGFSYAFVDAKLIDPVLRVDKPSVVVAPAGTRLPGTARNTISASLEHAFNLPSGLLWTNRLGIYYQGPTENAISALDKYKHTWPGFSQLGLSSTLSGDKWSASLYVKNLTNNAGITGGFLEQHMGTDPSQNYHGNGSKVFISQPRTVGVSVAYAF